MRENIGLMEVDELILTDVDQLRLRELLNHFSPCDGVAREYVELLSEWVKQARVVDQRNVPRDVVTMNSLIGMRDLDINEKWSCTLALPQDADLVARKVSVVAPLGATIRDRRVGDTVQCPVGSGMRHLCIERVYYQPEAAGDYHL